MYPNIKTLAKFPRRMEAAEIVSYILGTNTPCGGGTVQEDRQGSWREE